MPSSLAAQLAQSASLNASIFTDRSKRKTIESYLFSGREAAAYDLETVYSLGSNAFSSLALLDPRFKHYENDLFSDSAKAIDRTLLTKEVDAQLNEKINGFLEVLGPHLLEAPATKALEWLVRRFRIHEFNFEALLSLFLPYHETPHFVKMNSILHIPPNSTWSFLVPYKSAAQPIPRISLVSEMLKNSAVARFVASRLPIALKNGHSHHSLLSFNAATLRDFVIVSKTLDEGTVAFLLAAFLEPLQLRQENVPRDAILGSYILLVSLSQRVTLTPAALTIVIQSMINSARHVQTRQFLAAVVGVCEPQETINDLPHSAGRTVAKLSKLTEELAVAARYVGIDKFIGALLQGLLEQIRQDYASALVAALIETPSIPSAISRGLTTLLVERYRAADDQDLFRELLAKVHQRYPSVLTTVTEELIKDDEDAKVVVEQLLVEIAVAPSTSGKKNDHIIASSHAEARVRAFGVKNLIGQLRAANPEEKDAIAECLFARLGDTAAHVLDALYNTDPIALAVIFSKDSERYINTLAEALHGSRTDGKPPKKAVLKTHLAFFLAAQQQLGPDAAAEGCRKVLFPLLLFSKPRQYTAELVWDALAESSYDQELLRGCPAKWKDVAAELDGEENVERMARINNALAAQIADNIVVSSSMAYHVQFVMSVLQSDHAHSRDLGYLLVKALLDRVPAKQQTEIGDKVLSAIDLDHVKSSDPGELLLSGDLGKTVAMKPSSTNTLTQLQFSVLTVLAAIPRPTGMTLDWVGSAVPAETPEQKYITVKRRLYGLANSNDSSAMQVLLGNIFLSLKDDALLFLAGRWLARVAFAVMHASACLDAYSQIQAAVDLQTILPALLTTFTSFPDDAGAKASACQCIRTMKIITEAQRFERVYAFDAVYGSSEDARELEYLSQEDLLLYLRSLEENLDHLSYDATFVQTFHEVWLSKVAGEHKKQAEVKSHVLHFLLSHINSSTSIEERLALLQILSGVKDAKKPLKLLPSFKVATTGVLDDSDALRISPLLAATLDASASTELNTSNDLWTAFERFTKWCFADPGRSDTRDALVKAWDNGLLDALKADRKLALCNTLLDLAQDIANQNHCKSLLSIIIADLPVCLSLLDAQQPQVQDGPPAAKRAKVLESQEDTLTRLSHLSEVLATRRLPGSLDLLSRLLDTLSKVSQSSEPTRVDKPFVQQSLMSAIESVAEKITDIPNLTPSTIRLEVLVDIVRTSNNPQTFHQALLLIASLSRLAPESVLRDIMPVFTFMGSNVFHRDDTYSFTVVQKTVESVVPVMTSSLKSQYTDKLELFRASRDFLRVFADAANRVPRHRQTSFFIHLVDTLGPHDFLAPICMLLVEKIGSHALRKNAEDALALPLNIFHHYPTEARVSTLCEILREAQRLIVKSESSDSTPPAFLDDALYNDASPLPSSLFKRRTFALLTFVGYALLARHAGWQDGDMSQLVSLMIVCLEQKNEEVAQAAQTALTNCLRVMSATVFVRIAGDMMKSDNEKIQIGALSLFAERLPLVSDTVRKDVTSIVKDISSVARDNISRVYRPQGSELVGMSLHVLASISRTLCPGEEGAMADSVPATLKAIKAHMHASLALSALSPLPAKLGPRILPHFRELVAVSISILRDGSEDSTTRRLAGELLRNALVSLPAFWGGQELGNVIRLCIENGLETTNSKVMSVTSVARTVAKWIPAKALLPVLVEAWPTVEQSPHTRAGPYFDLMKRGVRNAPRDAVQEHLRSVFQVFLGAFGTVARDLDDIETQQGAIYAFVQVVVKLNDTAFKPLFRRLYDWSFVQSNGETGREVVFCRVYKGLLDYFKGLVTPYMSFALQSFVDLLRAFRNASPDTNLNDGLQLTLWLSVVDVLAESFSFDDGGFWREDKLAQIAPVLTAQVPVCVGLGSYSVSTSVVGHPKAALSGCLVALAECASNTASDSMLKAINLDVLMHTRSEDTQVRLTALSCADALWRAHGGKLLGFAPETATFLVECAEDENDLVVREAFRVKEAVETVAGNIDG